MPKDLLSHNCIRDWNGSIQQWDLEKDGRKLDVAVDGSLILNDWFLILNAVLDGLGVGYFPEIIVSSHVANRRLVRLLEEYPGI